MFSRKIACFCLLSAMLVTASIIVRGPFQNEKIGFTVHPDCHDCDTKTLEFFECFHISEYNPCSVTLCIIDHYIYAKCADGAPQEQAECVTQYDASAIRVQQWKVQPPPGPLNCGEDKGYIPVPGYPAGNCYWGGTGRGKCFLSGCSGTILEQDADRLGREKCI